MSSGGGRLKMTAVGYDAKQMDRSNSAKTQAQWDHFHERPVPSCLGRDDRKDPPPPSESLHQNHISYDGVHTLLYIQQLNSDTETFLPANIKRLKCRFVE